MQTQQVILKTYNPGGLQQPPVQTRTWKMGKLRHKRSEAGRAAGLAVPCSWARSPAACWKVSPRHCPDLLLSQGCLPDTPSSDTRPRLKAEPAVYFLCTGQSRRYFWKPSPASTRPDTRLSGGRGAVQVPGLLGLPGCTVSVSPRVAIAAGRLSPWQATGAAPTCTAHTGRPS